MTPTLSGALRKAISTPTLNWLTGTAGWPTGWRCGLSATITTPRMWRRKPWSAHGSSCRIFARNPLFPPGCTGSSRTGPSTGCSASTRAGPAVRLERNLMKDAITDAIQALPPAQRITVVLHHLEGLSYAEVAAVTDSSVAAVRSHLFRARRTLGVALQQWR